MSLSGNGLPTEADLGERTGVDSGVHTFGHTSGPLLKATVQPTVQPPLGLTQRSFRADPTRPCLRSAPGLRARRQLVTSGQSLLPLHDQVSNRVLVVPAVRLRQTQLRQLLHRPAHVRPAVRSLCRDHLSHLPDCGHPVRTPAAAAPPRALRTGVAERPGSLTPRGAGCTCRRPLGQVSWMKSDRGH